MRDESDRGDHISMLRGHCRATIPSIHVCSHSTSQVYFQLFYLRVDARRYSPFIVVARRLLSRSASHPLRLRVPAGNMSLSNAKIVSREPLVRRFLFSGTHRRLARPTADVDVAPA